MIIQARLITRPRRTRYCAHCRRLITGAVLRLYGCGETGDPPYVLWLHPACNQDDDPKIQAALISLTAGATPPRLRLRSVKSGPIKKSQGVR